MIRVLIRQSPWRCGMSNWTIGDGKFIGIEFNDPLLGDVTDNVPYFKIVGQEYTYVPGGVLIDVEYTVVSVSRHSTIGNAIIIEVADKTRFPSVVGDIIIYYAGGTLQGTGGAVEAFRISFTPTGLIPKPHQNNIENIEITNITAIGNLIQVYYSDFKAADENIQILSITAVGKLTHIDDI